MNNNFEKSIWVTYLDPSYKDPYLEYKEFLAIKLERFISNISNELLNSNHDYDTLTARNMAINLVMEQMLTIQYENTPEIQKAMIINLFCEHPSTLDFKVSLMNKLKEVDKKPIQKNGKFKNLLKKLFKL